MLQKSTKAMLSAVKMRLFAGLLLVLGLSFAQKANACHWASGEIYATYIGAGMDGCTGTTDYTYRVSVVLYFACQTCNLIDTNQRSIRVLSPSTGDEVTGVRANLVIYDTVSQLCPTYQQQNSCLIPGNRDTYPAYKRAVFEVDVTVPTARPDWTFSTEGGGRPTTNKNIPSGNMYISTMINNVVKYNNSAPRFLSSPLRYLCTNQENKFLNGPFDINGDSLVTEHIAPLQNATTPINFTAGYSPTNPLDTDPSNPYKLDPVTGTATFTPNQTGQYQLTYRVSEYERGTGILLGHSMRDISIQILNCAEPPPPVDSIPVAINGGKVVNLPGGGRAIYTCPGSNINFSINSTAQLAASQLYMEAEMPGMPGATFTPVGDGTSSVTGTFDWTPSPSDVGDHTLIITSKDSTCTGSGYTIVQKTSTVYTIRVTPGIDLGPDVPICAVDTRPEQLFVQGGENLTLVWEEFVDLVKSPNPEYLRFHTDIQNPLSRLDSIENLEASVMYRVSTPDLLGSTCASFDTVVLYYDTSTTLQVFPEETVILCQPDFVQLEALIKGDKPTGNVPCGTEGELLQCLEPDTVEIYGSSAYGKNSFYDSLGSSTPVLVNKSHGSKHEYLITKEELNAYNMQSGTLRSISFDVTESPAPGNTHPYENFRILIGCTDVKDLNASAGFSRQGDGYRELTEVYRSTAPLFFDIGSYKFEFKEGYNRDTAMGLIVQICYDNSAIINSCTNPQGSSPMLRFVPTSYTSGLFLTSNIPDDRTVCGAITADSIVARTARPKFTFGYCPAPPTDFAFWWRPGTLTSDSSIQQPLAYIPKTTEYLVETYGRSGCLLRDSVTIYIPDNEYSITPFDTAICYGTDAIMTVEGGFYYRWFEYTEETDTYTPAITVDCNTCKTVRARPFESTHYRVAVFDSVFCLDTIDAWVTVLPRPEVKLLTGDTIIKYGQSIPLLATGARQYNWMPSSSLSTPNTSSPIATPTEPTTYVVTGIGSNGCRSFDTVEVDIDYRDNILVPTAFSPNGDGRNDLFRVANLTFQQIMEFRIFNRWGQEVFSTHDARTGWDGTWQGVDQPIDNYRYIIRVGFPDGLVETYKGDVTLIR